VKCDEWPPPARRLRSRCSDIAAGHPRPDAPSHARQRAIRPSRQPADRGTHARQFVDRAGVGGRE